MSRILLLMPTHSYRAEAFLEAAARPRVDVTVGTEREEPLAHLVPGSTLSLDFRSPEAARQQVLEFAQRYPLPRGTRYLGFIFARGATPAAVEASLRAAHGRLDFDIRSTK